VRAYSPFPKTKKILQKESSETKLANKSQPSVSPDKGATFAKLE
jgi:hypothetical protein